MENSNLIIRFKKYETLSNIERSLLVSALIDQLDAWKYGSNFKLIQKMPKVESSLYAMKNYLHGIYDGFAYIDAMENESVFLAKYIAEVNEYAKPEGRDYFENTIQIRRTLNAIKQLHKEIKTRVEKNSDLELSENQAHAQNF